jgi:hypothetical protein
MIQARLPATDRQVDRVEGEVMLTSMLMGLGLLLLFEGLDRCCSQGMAGSRCWPAERAAAEQLRRIGGCGGGRLFCGRWPVRGWC